MSNVIYLDGRPFHLVVSSELVRSQDSYQKVRSQINRLNSPLTGSTDWKLVKDECENLAHSHGLDLMMCGYYAIASMKVQGLAGFANGMELMATVVSVESQFDSKAAKAQKELIDWVVSKALVELKTLKPNYEVLRELYRCEQSCSRLHDTLQVVQSSHLPNLEALGFVIFEHIDRLETLSHSNVQHHTEQSTEETKSKKKAFYFGTAVGVVLAVITMIIPKFLPAPEVNYYVDQTVATLKEQGQVEVFKSAFDDNQRQDIRPQVVPLYASSVTENLQQPFYEYKAEAQAFASALKSLYPEDQEVKELYDQVQHAKLSALESNQRYMERFSQIRTQMANLSLLAQKGKLRELQSKTKSMEDFAVSLSPIYGRAVYVDDLIEQGQISEAQRELDILKQRLENLTWKVLDTELLLKDK
ncbi:type VI secretion system ImpA family N-terminal domain-containing protein [Vibrio sp. SCSIO 43135]|uniref:type VI secretion system ImpA family N-terminal domain-containing protein n=1 Tax=Vibrio sp. SCSIO 43135 TaxID=2819096 RepID=UPI002075F939|nr:type VI secretion system ImpA family N-terminal domain-containing protein [Vibrio sp. SCSIO 43135]USD43055.1 type VI secretion system ImpA family N-terminal domain-containing protein [Vibrio sp. SCSIO 43135]